MSFIAELWKFMKVHKKILAAADHHHDGHIWRAGCPQPRVRCRTIHLYDFLGLIVVAYPWCFRVLS